LPFRYDAFEGIEQRGRASAGQPGKIVTAPLNDYTIPEKVTSEAGESPIQFCEWCLYTIPAVSTTRFHAEFLEGSDYP
jgi:hypothetical protein